MKEWRSAQIKVIWKEGLEKKAKSKRWGANTRTLEHYRINLFIFMLACNL